MRKVVNTYFDTIDNPNKAYWLGFLWCDGYIWHRQRGNGNEYGMKLDLMKSDSELLYRLKEDIGIHTSIKFYGKYASSFGGNGVSRCSYYNKHLVSVLMNKYGIVPNRTDVSPLLNNLPKEYEKDFIRGCLDADGSFCIYHTMDNGHDIIKICVSFGGTETLLKFIWEHLKTNNLTANEEMPKINRRHEDRDGIFRELKLCGRLQGYNILHYLYEGADRYLPRKYDKYIAIKEEIGEYVESQCKHNI